LLESTLSLPFLRACPHSISVTAHFFGQSQPCLASLQALQSSLLVLQVSC